MTPGSEQDGFRIVLTPGQFAALLVGGTIEIGQGGSIDWTRVWGGLKLLFGGLEELGAGALILAPDPTTITKWAGGALALHGADTLQSGGRQLWTGREARTLTDEGTHALARALGVNEQTAREISAGVDMAVPIALTLGVGAARLLAVRSGRVVLAEHEAVAGTRIGGHTILKHVAQTDEELAARLAQTKWLKAVSTFASISEAERAITTVFRVNRANIVKWARAAKPNDKEAFLASIPGGVGRVLNRGATTTVAGKVVRIIIKKESYNGKLYYVLTAYPQ